MKKLILLIAIVLFAGLSAQAEPTYRFAGRGAQLGRRAYSGPVYSATRSTYGTTTAGAYGTATRSSYGTTTRTGSAYGTATLPSTNNATNPIANPVDEHAITPADEPMLYDNGGSDGWEGGFLEPPAPMEDALPVLSLLALAFAAIRLFRH